MERPRFTLTDDDLRQISALLASSSDCERHAVYEEFEPLFFKNQDLSQKIFINQGKKQVAEAALRSVLYFLDRRYFTVSKDGQTYSLSAPPLNTDSQ